ncbi:MAG: SDR family NAD(P)-dependent oxidoreductase [Rhodospirillales bacterium]|jgi:3-oxoacyl-[acyl-carrier protein] reductase
MSKQLEGQVALLTGAVRRNGRAIALALANEGANIVINARNSKDEAEALAKEVEATGAKALVHLADVTDRVQVDGMVDNIIKTFGRIDILLNNAADRGKTDFLKMSFEEWRHICDIILDGAFHCSQAVIPHMIKQGGGRIINMGGMTARTSASGRAHVVTAKSGIEGFTRALAFEFAKQKIAVNCISPGKIGGERSKTSGEVALTADAVPPVGYMGEPENVAVIAHALCLPAAAYTTGQTINVNGGMFMS